MVPFLKGRFAEFKIYFSTMSLLLVTVTFGEKNSYSASGIRSFSYGCNHNLEYCVQGQIGPPL